MLIAADEVHLGRDLREEVLLAEGERARRGARSGCPPRITDTFWCVAIWCMCGHSANSW
jgi:hypothetical protein